MNVKPIYLDYASTTPIHPDVAKCIFDTMMSPDDMGNPSSTTHSYGWHAQIALNEHRTSVGKLIGAKPREIVFTSGATESNNIAIQGVLQHLLDAGEAVHAITSSVEHKAVLDTFAHLESLGVDVTYLEPSQDGSIWPDDVEKAIKDNTKLVSLMHVNNETGSINNLMAIGAICRENNVLFHVDAAQSAGKLPIDVRTLPIDLLSLSGHKMYAPKGIGGLFVKSSVASRVKPIMFGGSQERSLRPGTQSTPLIAGFAKAADIASHSLHSDRIHVECMLDAFLTKLLEMDVPYSINGTLANKSPYILNLHLPGTDNDMLLTGLKLMSFSTGSACNSVNKVSSHVLQKLIPDMLESGANIRISFGRNTTEHEVLSAAEMLATRYNKLIKATKSFTA